MSVQTDHNIHRRKLTGTASSGDVSLSPPENFNSFIRQIIVMPTTKTGLDPTSFNLVIEDEEGEIYRYNGAQAWYNTVINPEGEQAPPLQLPAYGTLTVKIEASSRDEAFTVYVYYN